MRIGIIAEGHADIAVVKAVLKAITGIDTSIGWLKKNSKYIDTVHNNLNYVNLGKDLTKQLKTARMFNESLNLFCIEMEEKIGSRG